MTGVYSKLCEFIVSGMSVTLWDQLMLDARSSSLCRWFYEILVTWTVYGKKNFVKNYGFVILLFGLPGMANNNWYTNRRRRWVCRIKICDLPQTRRAVFLLHTSARNTKTPCWNFYCWYSKLGSLHRKSSKKDWDVDIIFIKSMKKELKWTLSLGTGRVLHVKKTNSFSRQSIWIFFFK